MAQPTIITSDSKGYPALSDANAATRTYQNVTIPANANTVIVMCVMDTTELYRSFTDLTIGDVAIPRTHLIDVSSGSTRSTVAAIFNTTNFGVLNEDITVTINTATPVGTRLGVVCSTGHVESYQTSNDRSSLLCQSLSYSLNYENNIFVLMNSFDMIDTGIVYTVGTELYQSSLDTVSVGVTAAVQDVYDLKGTKKIAYTCPEEDSTELGVVLADEPNAFGVSIFSIPANIGTGISEEYNNSTILPVGRDFGTKRYKADGTIIPNYIHTDFPNG